MRNRVNLGWRKPNDTTTNGLFNLQEQNVAHVEIGTQYSIVEGRSDIVIMFPNHLVYIEVKVESGLGHRQLARYRLDLAQSGHQYTRLILLSRYPFSATDVEQPDYAIRWYQIAEWLEAEVRSGLRNQHSHYVVQQFIGFLQHRNITIQQVRSEIAQAIRAYQASSGEAVAGLGRMRSLSDLAKPSDLLPLHNLLMMLGEALASENIQPKPKFDSGSHNGGWIGYNVDKMRYWFFVYYTRPDCVIFDAEKCDVRKIPSDVFMGKMTSSAKQVKWRNELDLVSPNVDFFAQSKDRQTEIIEQFLRESYQFARSIALEV